MSALTAEAVETGLLPVLDLYLRISKDYDGTLRSTEDQEETGREWCEENGYQVGMVFKDHALSAYNEKVKRPEWDKLMKRLMSGQTDGVWIRDLGRFTRKMQEGLDLREAWKLGRTIASGRSGVYDLDNAEGLDQFLSQLKDAEVESKRISDRTKNGKAKKVRKRGRSNASWRGFARPGYLMQTKEERDAGALRVPVPAEQLAREVDAVRRAVAGLLDGTTNLTQVAELWNSEELLTVTGKRWSNGDIRQLLSAPSLAGLLEHKGELVGELGGEPVLDRATWDRLQLHFSSKKRGRPASTYLGSAILRCGRCDSILYGRPVVKQTPYPDGEVRRQYWCQKRTKEGTGCGQLTIDQRFADSVLEDLTVRRLADPKNVDRINRVAAKVSAELAEAQAELDRLNREADDIASKAGKPGWTPARINQAMEQYGELIEEAQERVSGVGTIPPSLDPAADVQEAWDGADIEERRSLVRRAYPHGLTVLPATSRGRASLNAARIVPRVGGAK